MKIRSYINTIKSKALIGVLFLSSIQIFGQGKNILPATVVDNKPSVQKILTALEGQGLKIKMIRTTPAEVPYGKRQDFGFVAGAIDASKVHTSYAGKGQVAIFKNGFRAGLGMDSGVLFSTGDAKAELLSRNKQTESSNTYGLWHSDPDLTKIYPAAYLDAFVLEFDVVLEDHVSALRVAFQFGSEEYPDYVGSKFNDSFGFFVSGPGVKTEEGKEFNSDGSRVVINMARNPTNHNTISINTINGGQVGADSEQYVAVDLRNKHHYINNGHITDLVGNYPYQKGKSNRDYPNYWLPKPVFIEYNGITELITYDLTGLQGGQTYRFKIAIADSNDPNLDSGVLIHKIHGTIGADLSIKKVISNMSPEVGDEVEFTLTAENLGPYPAKDIIVTDLLPDGYTFISSKVLNNYGSYNEKSGVWSFKDLAVAVDYGLEPILKIKALVNSTGEYTNKASITVKEPKKYPDDFPENNKDEVTPDVQKPAAIGLVKIGEVDDTVDGAHGNGVINYTFIITNEGDVPLKEINLEDFKIENQRSTIKPFNYVFKGDDNNDKLLNVGEEWSTTATYHITDADTDAEKVENRATVYGKSPKDVEVSAESSDEQGNKQPTITPVEGGGPLMTNPHIYHKVQ